MKSKNIIFVLSGLGIILAVLGGIYWFRQSRSIVNPAENTTKAPTESQEKTEGGARENKLATDDFSVDLPAGWKQTAPPMGASVMAIIVNENINDPAAQKINFKSYFAVSYDTLQGKSLAEYVQTVKSGLQGSIPSAVFTKEQDLMVNDRFAQALEAELTQQGVNFKILMVIIAGEGEDVWVISFNTTKSGWDGYRETFYNVANSFRLRR